MKSFFKKFSIIDILIDRFSSYALVVAVMSMLALSIGSIVLRWFDISYVWIETLVRHLVFLSAFLGGVIATGRGVHISIDLIQKYLENHKLKKLSNAVKYIVIVASIFTLSWLIYASVNFAIIEMKYGKISLLGVHTGFLVAIIPFGFSLILMRFICIFFKVGDNC